MIFVDIGQHPTADFNHIRTIGYHRTELDNQKCNCCKKLVHNMLSCKAECHPNADLVLWYYDGILFVTCAECESEVGYFTLAERKDNYNPFANEGKGGYDD